MIIKQHKELIKREKQLHEDMKNFILNVLKDNNGRISYVSENTDDEDLSLDEKYPIISTLWGKHDTYNIAITDVYLKEYELGQVEIYANGIDQNTETVKKEFPVYSEQFSDIIHFITVPVRDCIYEYASKLALKDLVDKNNKLPDGFKNEQGIMKNEYREEYITLLDSYQSRIEELMSQCSDPSPDKDNINSELMEIICELAELALIEQNQLLTDAMTENRDGEIRYTEEKQDEFNLLYDEIENEVWTLVGFDGIN